MAQDRPWLIVGIGTIFIFLIGLVDYLIKANLSLSICYLLPIFIGTRYLNKHIGIFLAISSAISLFLGEIHAHPEESITILILNTFFKLTVFIIIVHLLSALKNAYEQEKKLARLDELTKIYNRRYFLEILKFESKRAIRYNRCLTLTYFDVDNFKKVNDLLGHGEGDRLLQLIAQTVKKNIRETDIVARIGGDEFVLLLPETEFEPAEFVLQRIRTQLLATVKANSFDVGFSMGAITFRCFPDSVDSMLEKVDKLMYRVKDNGKNQIEHQLCDL